MITFKNITGNKFLAVGTIQRKSALNGEKSLTGTLYDGDDVLNKIDKGWSLEFDNEPYIVTYFERNDNDNSVSFDAIHKFFWDMAKNVLYSETSGSHTIKWYLDQIFADAGYTYALNFNPNAIAKDNWGMKNKLSLFNDIITSIEGEFEINGTLVSIFKNIGTDLSTIVRYGFNLSDMTIENDASGFVTYGEGFGAYADQENMTGDRLHVTYTSPLASVYGKLQAEPIDDQRYTIESNLLDAVKSQVDGSFSISVNLSLYDLSVAGYPYKMANVGDWLTAVDENLDFKQRIRIISIDDAFAADGTRISYSVTAGDIGLTKKYQDANASIANKVENAVISAGQAATDANIALIAANGKNKSYYLNDINDLPKTANEGDLAWVQSGDGRVLYIYTKKADGTYYWEKRIDPEMGEQIEAGVNEAIAQANENTATAIEENNISQQEVMNDIAKSQADLAIKDGDFNNKAQAMVDKALSDAKANTATVAKETLDTATDNLNSAKQSLTTDLQKEISDRTDAVATLDTKAKGYADDVKNSLGDELEKEISDREEQVSGLDSKAKGYADQAKQDAIDAANDSVNKEVADRNSAISALDTKSSNAIGQAKTDITQTINALTAGSRNYWSLSDRVVGSYIDVDGTIKLSGTGLTAYNPKYFSVLPNKTIIITLFDTDPTAPTVAAGRLAYYDQDKNFLSVGSNIPIAKGSYKYVVPDNVSYFRISLFKYDDIRTKVEIGTLATDWTPAPEDIAFDYTDKDNQIKQTFTQYQQSNDGKVSKAQTDATQALGLVATKVSQTDFDTKTGDLSTKYNSVKQTVDEQANEIADIQTKDGSQDSKINSITSDVNGTKQNMSDIQKSQSEQSTKINQITTDVNGTKQSITDIQAKDGQQDTRMGTIETSVSGVKSDFSTYKTDANGRISTAQTTAQTAVDGLNTKVSQTDYNTKTGQLQTDLTTTTQTANQAKTDIVSIKQTDTSQDSRMNTIESDASGTKQTVSQLQTVQGQQSGSISTLQQRADGFDAIVTKVNNLSVGGRNLLLGSAKMSDASVWSSSSLFGSETYQGMNISANTVAWYGPKYKIVDLCNRSLINETDEYTFSGYIRNTSDTDVEIGFYATDNVLVFANPNGILITKIKAHTDWTRISVTFKFKNLDKINTTSIRFEPRYNVTNGFINQSGLKLEQGNMPTEWSPAPEDIDQATAKAQLTADQATTALNNYKTDADGRISKAQSDITQTAKDITTKVSQNDYNTKTGELTTSVNDVTQTANRSKQDIVAINQKDSDQDSRMTSIESDASGVKTTVSAIQTKQGQQSGDISTLQQRADGFDATVTKVNNLAVGGRNYWSFTNKIDGQLIYPDGSITNSGSGLTAYNPNYFDIKQGQTVWVTIYNTISTNNATLAGRLVYYDKDKNFISSTSDIAITQGNYKNIAPSNSAYFRISLFKYTNIKIKVEIGTLYTDWTPAPEDVDSATAKAQLTADQANTSLNAYKTDADGRITKAQSDITQTAKDVTTKVSQSDYNVKTGELTTSVSKAQQTADSAVTTIGSYKTSNDNRVKATETSIAQNAKDIALMATTSDLNAAKSDYTTKISQVQVNVDGISQSVSQVNTKVDGLTVGGRNYWSLSNKIDTKYIEQDGTIKTSGTGLTAYNPNYFSVSSGKTIIISILDTDQNAPTTLAGRLAYYDENKNFLFVTNNIPIAKGIYEKIVPSGVSYFRISLFKYLDLRTKVEIGDLPTDWTPAPEDVDNKFASQQITIDGITNTVSNQGTNISNLTSRVQTAEGTLSTATNNISGLQSKQTQTSNQISQEITDRANGDSNTLQSSKDFTTSQINNSETGTKSLITQTADGIMAKVDTKTDSDTVLSLLKDNWSIGISDNIGKITSGIVGNASQMSLISKNVTIDSPNTQIKGTAWINSAMIANGAIGSAQIGDASITSAKIISLDVARLTGNVSNFIQSNWNGIYGSTYITADGMSVSSGTVTTSFGSQGMRITMASNGGVVIQAATKSSGTQTGVLIGMNVGSTFTSFGFQSSSNYLYNDEMVILKTGSAAAGDYNIGGGVAFNHNVSFMDNIYMKYGKGFYGKWGDPQQAIFFQTINSGIPAIMHISGAGIAFGHKGDLYMLSHGGYQDFNNSSIKGSYTVDQPWITG